MQVSENAWRTCSDCAPCVQLYQMYWPRLCGICVYHSICFEFTIPTEFRGATGAPVLDSAAMQLTLNVIMSKCNVSAGQSGHLDMTNISCVYSKV